MKKVMTMLCAFLFLGLAACGADKESMPTGLAEDTEATMDFEIVPDGIDTGRVYANGYSGGGETMSLVLSKRPDLFTAYLHVSSQWDGSFEEVAGAQLPIYFVVGRNDEYYGSDPTTSAYNSLHELYEQQGLSEEEIDGLLVLDIKEHEYFTEQGAPNEHGGGTFVAYDEEIMGWLFSKVSDTEEYADNEAEGNLFFLEKEGGSHSGEYALLYIYNGLR